MPCSRDGSSVKRMISFCPPSQFVSSFNFDEYCPSQRNILLIKIELLRHRNQSKRIYLLLNTTNFHCFWVLKLTDYAPGLEFYAAIELSRSEVRNEPAPISRTYTISKPVSFIPPSIKAFAKLLERPSRKVQQFSNIWKYL